MTKSQSLNQLKNSLKILNKTRQRSLKQIIIRGTIETIKIIGITKTTRATETTKIIETFETKKIVEMTGTIATIGIIEIIRTIGTIVTIGIIGIIEIIRRTIGTIEIIRIASRENTIMIEIEVGTREEAIRNTNRREVRDRNKYRRKRIKKMVIIFQA